MSHNIDFTSLRVELIDDKACVLVGKICMVDVGLINIISRKGN